MIVNDSFQKCFTLSFDSWTAAIKIFDTQQETKVRMSAAQFIISPKCSILAHQTPVRFAIANKTNKVAIFEKPFFWKIFVGIDGVIYPRDVLNIDYASNDFPDQNRDPKLFYKGYVVEELMIILKIYWYEKNYSIQVIDLRFRVARVNPKKFIYLRNREVLPVMLDCI